MITFTFRVGATVRQVLATSTLRAFAEANRLFGIGGEPGAWMDSRKPRSYYWAPGDFCS